MYPSYWRRKKEGTGGKEGEEDRRIFLRNKKRELREKGSEELGKEVILSPQQKKEKRKQKGIVKGKDIGSLETLPYFCKRKRKKTDLFSFDSPQGRRGTYIKERGRKRRLSSRERRFLLTSKGKRKR